MTSRLRHQMTTGMTMILDERERLQFIAYCEQTAETCEQMATQLDDVGGDATNEMARRERAKAFAYSVVAKDLAAVELVERAPVPPPPPNMAYPNANHESRGGCDHEFVDARNEVVKSGTLCVKCGAIEPGVIE